jgi:hypothetical protein
MLKFNTQNEKDARNRASRLGFYIKVLKFNTQNEKDARIRASRLEFYIKMLKFNRIKGFNKVSKQTKRLQDCVEAE